MSSENNLENNLEKTKEFLKDVKKSDFLIEEDAGIKNNSDSFISKKIEKRIKIWVIFIVIAGIILGIFSSFLIEYFDDQKTNFNNGTTLDQFNSTIINSNTHNY